MENLDEKLSNLIKESLPEKVGAELQQVLKQAKTDKEELSITKDKNKSLSSSIEAANSVIKELQDLISQHADIQVKTEKLEEKERNLKVSELTIKLEESEKRADMVRDFTNSLVRNTIVRESVLDTDMENIDGYADANGNWVPSRIKNTTKSFDKTKTTE